MKCPKCNKVYPDKDSYCKDCGVRLIQDKNMQDSSAFKQKLEKHSTGEGINLGDTGMIKDSSFHTETHIDSHDTIGAPAVGGNLHVVTNIGGDDKSKITKIGEHCPICGSLAKDDYFKCKSCGFNFICKEHLDKEHLVCSECAIKLFGAKKIKTEGKTEISKTDAVKEDINKQINIAVNVFGKDTEAKSVESPEIKAQKVTVEQPSYTSPAQMSTEKKKSMLVPVIVGMLLLIIGILGYKFIFSKKEPGIVVTGPPVADKMEGIPTEQGTQEPLQPTKAILEVGIFYEDRGRLHPLKDGMTLHSKDNYAIYFKPNKDSYVYIFQIDTNGQAFKLFPNPEEYKTINNPLRANRAYWMPAEGKFFFLDDAVGKEEIFFFASKRPIKSLEEIKTTSKMVMKETTKLMGVGGTTESKMSIEVVTKGETLPFDMVKTKINSSGDLVYNTWFWHE